MKIKPVMQVTNSECGLCCVSMVAQWFGCSKPMRHYRQYIDAGRDGISVKHICELFDKIGMKPSIVRMNTEALGAIKHPFIACVTNDHFVVVEKINLKKNKLFLIDPAQGRTIVEIGDFIDKAEGFAIISEPGEHFERGIEKERIWRPLFFLADGIALSMFLSLTLSVVTYMFTLVVPLLLRRYTDSINLGEFYWEGMKDYVTPLLAAILFLIVSIGRNYILVRMEMAIDRGLLMKMTSHLLKLPYKYYETRSTGEILFRINLLNNIRLLISEGLIRFVIDIGGMFFVLLFMWTISQRATIISIAVLIMIFSIANYNNTIIVSRNKRELQKLASVTSNEAEMVEMIFDIKCLRVEDLVIERLKKNYLDFQHEFKKRESWSRWNISLMQFFQMFLPFLVLLVVFYYDATEGLTIGGMVAFYSLSTMVIGNCISLVQEYSNIRLMKNYILRINDVLEERVDCKADRRYDGRFDELEVTNLSFRYSDNSSTVLDNISMSIKSGKRIAIVGGSGAGKSTLIKMLLGLYQPTCGTVRINGEDINMLDAESFERLIGVIPQDTRLFNDTIEYNITMGRDVSKEVLDQAMIDAKIYDDVQKMPLKEKTRISAGGRNLSGGQRQRIAIARMFVRNPEIIMLDEATSSLDGINEKEIIDILNGRECAQILVSHRFSTLQHVDYVYVMDRGRIVEEGDLDELIDKGGVFFELFEKQMATESRES